MSPLFVNGRRIDIEKVPPRDVDMAVIEASDADHMVIAFLNATAGECVAKIRVAFLDIQVVAGAVVAGAKDKGIVIPLPQFPGRDEPPAH